MIFFLSKEIAWLFKVLSFCFGNKFHLCLAEASDEKNFVLQTGGFPVVRLNISGMITIFNPVFNSEAGAGRDLLIVIKLLFET